MENNEILAKLEKYSPWIKTNRKFAGHVFVISIVYILVYLGLTFYLWNDIFKLSSLLQGLYFIGFGIFLIVIYLAFFGFLLRSVNKKNINLEAK
ncbi:hypothetical protein KY342_05785 [Candidatus Woesearchaeota archaeon]|nr:hypothetical protein [Candidatus Woesearchaeota archaeon]